MKTNRHPALMTLLINVILLLVTFTMQVYAERIVVTNGDFSSGASGFTSNYSYHESDLTIEGRYSVGSDPNDFHPSWPSGSDHTTGAGLMFIANGSSNTSAIVWQGTPSQDLIVGQTYDFSAWIMDVYTSGAHASLTFKADDEVIGTLTCSSYQTWTRLSGSFTAQNVRPTLTLTNAQSALEGNDFAVDDINIYYEGSTTPPTEAELTTSSATSISQSSATLGGNITDDGGDTITERGVVYSSTDTKPYIGDTGVTQNENGSGTGEFSEVIGSLSPGTTYYYQAYAIHAQGTAYGGVETFTTADVNITFINGASVTLNFQQSNANPPESNWLCGQFSLVGDIAGATLISMTVTLGGTYDSDDVTSTPFQIYGSNTNDFSSSSALGSSTADPGSGSDITFSGLNDALSPSVRYYWVTVDIAENATGDDTMNGTVDGAGDLDITASTLSGLSSYGKLNAGSDASLPVDLAKFSARCKGRSVLLEWTTESETDNLGFIIERKTDDSDWMTIASYLTHDALQGQGNTSSASEYAFTDLDVEPKTTYDYRLSDVSIKGKVNIYASLSVTVDAAPEKSTMENAYPNPFNPQTFIAYHLSDNVEVNITVFNLLGRQIKTLYTGQQLAGSYHVYWNAMDKNGSKVPSGSYFIRMQTDNYVQVQKVLLMK